jgi:hypothetical protein
MVQLRYIVTGTGRSGTVALATILTHAGIPCSHERFFSGKSLEESLYLIAANGGENSLCSQHCGLPRSEEQVMAESSYMAAPYLGAPCLAATTVVHAVRNPWRVILSFLNNIHFFRGEPEHEHERFIYSVLPQLHEIGNPIDRAVSYYFHWNRMIETLARRRWRQRYIFHRIEDGAEPLLKKLGLSANLSERSLKNENVNSFRDWPGEMRDLTPAQQVRVEHINASIFAAQLQKLAKRYGYDVPTAEESVRGNDASGLCSRDRLAQRPRLLEAGYRGYNLVRWQSHCYALPQGEQSIDLEVIPEAQLKEQVDQGQVVIAGYLSELKQKLDEVGSLRTHSADRGLPLLMESGYRGYNLVLWGGEYYALHQYSFPKLSLETVNMDALNEYMVQGSILVAPSLCEARERVDRMVGNRPELERGQPFESLVTLR